MAYGITPVGSDGIPLSSALVPGISNPVPIGGATLLTDSNSNQYTLVATADIEQSGYVAASSSPPSSTNVGSDTSYTFSSQVNRVIIENHTSANVYYAFDTAATQGSLKVAPGTTLIYPKKCTVLHLYTLAAQNINGTSDGNIVVLGAL